MTSPAGIPDFIHRYIPAEREGAPTLLLLHGTGGDENDLIPLGRSLLPGAGILSPRGRSLEHGMARFFRRLAPGVLDLEDLRERTHELADWIAAEAERYHFDPTRVVAVGYSNGANIAATLLLLRPGSLAGAVLLHAMASIEPEEQPNLPHVPVLLTGGRQDQMVPPGDTEHLAHLLRQAGAEVTLYWEPGGHMLTSSEVAEAQRWMAQWFGGQRAGYGGA